MANLLFPKYKEALLGAGINLSTGTVKALLVDTGAYTYSATHQFLSDVPSAARIASSAALTTKTVTNGVFDADDATFTSVPAGTGSASAAEALIIYVDTGTVGTSPLVGYLDTGVSGLPVTPNGGNISLTFNASGIFAL